MFKTPTKAGQSLGASNTPRTPQTPMSSYGSPSTKGKTANISGYLLSVSQYKKSKKGNTYFNLQIQVSKSEIIPLTVMQSYGNKKRDDFIGHVDSALSFESVFPGDDCYFYYSTKGSRHMVCVVHLDFELDYAVSTLETLNKKNFEGKCVDLFNVKVMIKYINDGDEHERRRKALIADNTGYMKLTLWDEMWFEVAHDTTYVLSHLQLSNNFGLQLSTTRNSFHRKLEEKITPAWPADIVHMCNIDEDVNISVENFSGASLKSYALCPKCKQPVQLEEGMDNDLPECGPCDSEFRVKKCKITGTVTIDIDDEEVLTLSIGDQIIDNYFGAGTCKLHARKVKSILRRKLMQIENVTICYTSRSLHITKITDTDECSKGKKRKVDGEDGESDRDVSD